MPWTPADRKLERGLELSDREIVLATLVAILTFALAVVAVTDGL